MKILYFSWGENSAADITDILLSLGHSVHRIQAVLQNYLSHPQLTAVLDKELTSMSFDFIFSFNYIPILSQAAEAHGVRYISWVYDCPHWTLYSTTLKNKCNYIFLFDRSMTSEVAALGAAHAFHMPLACHTARISRQLNITEAVRPKHYEHDISFVGSLYENNHYQRIQYIPDSLRGYLDGIMTAQKQIWGYDLIKTLLTPDIICELQKYLKLESNPDCPIPPHRLFYDILMTKITSDERTGCLNTLSKRFKTALYSNSNAGLCPDTEYKGTISYTEQMPAVFYKSKINLNITLRSITSGIPLRAIDIMGCGGFLLSNYQPELAEFFKPGQEFVYYEDLSDLTQKAAFYLAHEPERIKIAQAGYQKVKELFSYEKQLQKIFQICEKNEIIH